MMTKRELLQILQTLGKSELEDPVSDDTPILFSVSAKEAKDYFDTDEVTVGIGELRNGRPVIVLNIFE
ncbi:hypothetical protein U2F10_03110 [Leptothoe sp. EHU-05/26/07-4]